MPTKNKPKNKVFKFFLISFLINKLYKNQPTKTTKNTSGIYNLNIV